MRASGVGFSLSSAGSGGNGNFITLLTTASHAQMKVMEWSFQLV